MAREKKITIKPSLNRLVKGRRSSPLEEKKYPLYLDISYNRKFTRFPFGDNWLPLSEEPYLQDNERMKKAIEAVEKIIRYEIKKDVKFEVKGVAETIKSYLSPFKLTLLMLLIQHTREELKRRVPFTEMEELLSLPVKDQIKKGFDIFGEDVPSKLIVFLRGYQLLDLSEYEENILTWLIYESDEQREKVVENGVKELKRREPIYSYLPGTINIDENIVPSKFSNSLTKLAHLITENQIVMGAKIIKV